ncbi:MAG: 4-(cytidine 5'-diphospho)-2-C-methyl-D-erythritol kinase [Lachnospiraceae bacterium]|nr:4-(cytidine 5'-diphospho)-2-C-methyl-D-erythritol kinase [Lachnospiraceae bacterium]
MENPDVKTTKNITLKAYSKINLSLDVTGTYPNGYHKVRMVMAQTSLCDELTFEKIKEGCEITCNRKDLSTKEDNLIYKAYKAMKDSFNFDGGIKVNLTKKIPVAAGLAGGSSDAAACIKAINELYNLNAENDALCEIGAKIGADIPYCIVGGYALCEGIGEIITPIEGSLNGFILIVKPPIDVYTPHVYKELDKIEEYPHPDVEGMIKAVNEKNLTLACEKLGNVLEEVTVKEHPEIEEIKTFMINNGASGTLMSGSGPSVFAVFEEKKTAEKALESFKTKTRDYESFITELIN